MVSLRADGVSAILCPVGSDTLAGVVIMDVPPEEARRIMDGDPCVRAGMMRCDAPWIETFERRLFMRNWNAGKHVEAARLGHPARRPRGTSHVVPGRFNCTKLHPQVGLMHPRVLRHAR
jgi:hypothetical protein